MNVARNIVRALDPQPGEVVLEIGPGPGVLTALLVESGARVVALDVDMRAVEHLRERFAALPSGVLDIRHGDILAMDAAALAAEYGGALRVIGNLPYNITSQILFWMFDAGDALRDAVFMMQREVADRLVAPPGGKDYGILSVFTQVHAEVRRCFHVSPNVFTPRPAVWSSVVALRRETALLAQIRNYSFFRALVKATFGKRRKTLGHSLRLAGISTAALPPSRSSVLGKRPEQLPVGEFIELSNELEGYDAAADHAG